MQSDHWFLGFDDPDAANLVDIYPSAALLGEEKWATLRTVAGAAMAPVKLRLPHRVPHVVDASLQAGCDELVALRQCGIDPVKSVKLKPGHLILLPAGFPHAFKKWPSTEKQLPLVSLAGDCAWLGWDESSARAAIDLMIKTEKTLKKAYCLPEMSLLACLVALESSDLRAVHLTAAADTLRSFLRREEENLKRIKVLPPTVELSTAEQNSLLMCAKCEQVLHNATIWCRGLNSKGEHAGTTSYCPTCFVEAETGIGLASLDPTPIVQRRTYSKKKRPASDAFDAAERGDSEFRHTSGWEERHCHVITFRFANPTTLLEKLEESLSSPSPPPSVLPLPPPSVPPPPQPLAGSSGLSAQPRLAVAELVRLVSRVTMQQRPLLDHAVCTLVASMARSAELKSLQQDLLVFCHPEQDSNQACPLSQAIQSSTSSRSRSERHGACQAKSCKFAKGVDLPLYECPGERQHSSAASAMTFHLICAGYPVDLRAPSVCKVMCSSCLTASRGKSSLAEYRARHIWDTVKCPAELFREGYRLVEVPRDGLCFLSVMYMLAHRYCLLTSELN